MINSESDRQLHEELQGVIVIMKRLSRFIDKCREDPESKFRYEDLAHDIRTFIDDWGGK